MRVVDTKNTKVEETVSESASNAHDFQEPHTHQSYHELSDKPVQSVDAILQLHNNLLLLENLQARLSFVMKEVRYLMKV